MLAALIAATQIAYAFPAGVSRTYDVRVNFDGYLPILGGRDAKADLSMVVGVDGLTPDDQGRSRAASEIKDLKLVFNGATMPFNATNIQTYFPKTTVSVSPQGKVLATDAPNKPFPFRLPGLDVKKFPDITYLPIEFPSEGVEVGKSWTFTKTFNGSDMTYTLTATAIDDKSVELKFDLAQQYTAYEDGQGSPVESEVAALVKVETKLTGGGTATFDRTLGLVTKFEGHADTVSQATDVKSGASKERKLKTVIVATLKTS